MATSGADSWLSMKKTFCLVTGASRGLGRCLALKVSSKLTPGSTLLLIARNGDDLKKVSEECRRLANERVVVVLKSADLQTADADELGGIIRWALDEAKTSIEDYESALIFQNVGSLGDLSKNVLELSDANEWHRYLDLNVLSPLFLSCAFYKVFDSAKLDKQLVVNISSMAAIKPFKSWGFYCTGKAARDMIFRVMADENPHIRVINYSPGPLKTDMTIVAREKTADPEVRQFFIDAYAQGKMLDVEFTVDHLFSILEKDQFQSGDHIDVFDGNR